MCDINYVCFFNLLVAVVLIILQQHQHVVGHKAEQQQPHEQSFQRQKYISLYDGISSNAAVGTAKYVGHTTLPNKVMKRETTEEKSTDFISYMNDFNMQYETSIPEDIIDQHHLQEIIDKQQQGIREQQQPQQKLQQKYVGDSTMSTSVLNDDGGIIDVSLPYDDSTDTDLDADIILESQRSSKRSEDNNTSNNDSTIKTDENDIGENEMLSEEKKDILRNKKNFQKTNNQKEMLKEMKTLKYKNGNENKDTKKQQIIYENNIDNLNQYNVEGEESKDPEINAEENVYEDIFELDEYDDDDGSAEYERFKKMHEQQQKQQQQKQIESMSTQKTIMDEETFNTQHSIGKMFNNPANEKIKHMVVYTDGNNNNNNRNKNLNDYEIFHKHLLEQRQKQLKQQQQQQNQEEQPKEDAIGDIEDNEKQNIYETADTNSNNSNENKNNFANIFIPRKIKRHNGAARLDDATNKFNRDKKDEQQEYQHQQLNFQINTEESHQDAVAKVSSQEENFKKKYYDILKENSTLASDQDNQQHHHNKPSRESNPKDIIFDDDDDNNNENDSSHEVKKQTAFEREKSLRLNNKRYGHKMHKKKYKDYLRYSHKVMMATNNSIPIPEQNLTKTAMNRERDSNARIGLSKDDKHVKKLKLEEMKTLIPPSPIFLLKPRKVDETPGDTKKPGRAEESLTARPFYEGHISYFLETPDDDSERANEVKILSKGERVDTSDWYRNFSPVLRNSEKKAAHSTDERIGIGVARTRGGYIPNNRPQHRSHIQHGHSRSHRYRRPHHHKQQQHDHAGHSHQSLKSQHHRAYQRKLSPKRIIATTTSLPLASGRSLAGANGKGEIGHQITEIDDLQRYYEKWPHLALVESVVHAQDEQHGQVENNPDYDTEYDNDDYLEENDNKDDNLPPYIRKFNRRNKQLLDLLEGTIAPPNKAPQQLRWSGSKQQTGSRELVRIDDDYLKDKRKRYHQRQRQIHDLFAQQKTSTTTQLPPTYPYVKSNTHDNEMQNRQLSLAENHLPDEDVSISLESEEEFNSNDVKHKDGGDDNVNDDSKEELEIWQKEIKSKSAIMAAGNSQKANWQMEKSKTLTPIDTAVGTGAVTTKKSALHKLPSYPSIGGGYVNPPRLRSVQFAPSSGSEYRRISTPYNNNNNLNNNNDNMNNNNFINAGGFVAYNKAPVVSKTINGRFSANTLSDYNKQQQSVLNATATSSGATKTISNSNNQLNPPSPSMSSSPVTSSFIYHRVVDATPRLVGAGFITGRKQRLPFVAITDRRLETSKKSLTDHQKDFEQNRYPLP